MHTDVHNVALGYETLTPGSMQKSSLVYGGSRLLRQQVEHIKLCLAQGNLRSIQRDLFCARFQRQWTYLYPTADLKVLQSSNATQRGIDLWDLYQSIGC